MDNEKLPLTYPALTGIRAVAVYLVYLHHTNPFSVDRFGYFINGFISQFHIGVNIFFVLSGFLITLRYFESSKMQKRWLNKYLQNRIGRVYPMYFILTTVTMIVHFTQGQQDQPLLFTYFMNITFLRGFFDDWKFTLIAQGWSLTVEECFYLLAPLLFIVLRKGKWTLIAIAIGFILLGCSLVAVFSKTDFHGFFNSFQFLFSYTFFGRCAEFLIGAALVIVFQVQSKKEKKGFTYTLLGVALIILMISMMTILNMGFKSSIESMATIVINNFLLPAAIALFFYGLIREESLLKSILGSNLFITLGKASYTFYLIHVGLFYNLVNSYFPNDFLLTFLALNLISLALWFTLEEPLNRMIRSL